MAIRLITDTEHLTVEISGVVFHYRRPTATRIEQARARNTSRGKMDDEAFANEILSMSVFNWEGAIVADDGQPVPFDPALLTALPLKIKATLVDVIGEQIDGSHRRVDPS